jgi:outer membrane protein OmpA-like peptidoglycan-associated protein
MKKSVLRTLCIICLVSFSAAAVLSCAGPQTQRGQMRTGGAVLGAAGGAIAGALLGDFKGALWGAGIGAVVGGIAGDQVGRYMEQQEQEFQRALAYERDASIRREGEILVATYKNDMLFAFDSAEIKPGAYPSLDKAAGILNRYENTIIQIEGHTDSVGSEQYNMELSTRRADAVAEYLVSQGVNPARVRTVGFGESEPIADNDSPWGRSQNRRVEMVLEPIVAGG